MANEMPINVAIKGPNTLEPLAYHVKLHDIEEDKLSANVRGNDPLTFPEAKATPRLTPLDRPFTSISTKDALTNQDIRLESHHALPDIRKCETVLAPSDSITTVINSGGGEVQPILLGTSTTNSHSMMIDSKAKQSQNPGMITYIQCTFEKLKSQAKLLFALIYVIVK